FEVPALAYPAGGLGARSILSSPVARYEARASASMRQAFRPMHARRWDEMISTRHSGTWDEIPNALCRKAFGPLGVTHRETFRPYFVPSARMHGTKLRKLGRNRSGPESRFAESGTKSLLTKPSNYWANEVPRDGHPGTDPSRWEKRSRNWLRPEG